MPYALLMLAAVPAEAPCALQGWSTDADPTGLRVRAGPAISAREIGRLPAAIDGDDPHAPEFDIVDARGGWVKIANATDSDNPGTPRPVFAGTGWVHGSRVGFSLQTEKGRAGPSVHAPVLVESEAFFGGAGGAALPILGCSGGWLRLRYTLPADAPLAKGPRTGEAWFGGVCGNQHTTCDGLSEEKSAAGALE
jgi:hypothetical protein